MKTRIGIISAAVLSLASFAQGAISWQTPQTITGESDVSTNGALLYAYNFTTTAGITTVNGAQFANTSAFSVTNAYDFDFLSPSTGRAAPSDSGYGSGNFNALSSSYRNLLNQSIRASGGSGAGAANDAAFNAFAVTLNGLTIGVTYEVQVWISDSRSNDPATKGLGHLDRGQPGGVMVDYNVGDSAGNLGQYVVGTFTASETDEFFVFDTYAAPVANVALLNAFQVRIIPEPSSVLVAGGGFAFLMLGRRRK